MSKPKHHIREEVCSSRAPYRDGRKPTAVKVYTIHHESKYILIQGVSAVGASSEFVKLFETVGDIEGHRILDDYPSEQFTEVHLIKYKRIQSARFAKRKLDDWSFYGGVLHVCYAPEFETVQETRDKIHERRRIIEAKSRQYKSDGTNSNSLVQIPHSSIDRTRNTSDGGRSLQSTVPEDNTYRDSETNVNTFPSEQLHTQVFIDPSRSIQQYGEHIMPVCGVDYNTSCQGELMPSQHSIQSHGGQNLTSHKQSLLSYGEQVVQQACSLQNYGKSSVLNTDRLKRSKEDNDTQTENENVESCQTFSAEQLVLPPPLKQIRLSESSSNKFKKHNSAKVPSAQPILSGNFDTAASEVAVETKLLKNHNNLGRSFNKAHEKGKLKRDVNKPENISMQEKIEDNLQNKNVVIKDFSKKGNAPRFIPRQAQIKRKSVSVSDTNKSDENTSKTNELNKELRKNAFKLGKRQGPDLGPNNTSNESLDPKEKSVMESMLTIRRKLTKVND